MKLKLTAHARWRATQMRVPISTVKNILSAPDLLDYPSDRGEGYRVAVSGKLAVPYSLDGHAITVLWRGAEERWSQAGSSTKHSSGSETTTSNYDERSVASPG